MEIIFASLVTWFMFWMVLMIVSAFFEWNKVGDVVMKILAISALSVLSAAIIFIFAGMWMQALGYHL